MFNINLDNNALKYILFQRTELLVHTRNIFIKQILKIYCRVFKKDFLPAMINLECAIRKKGIKRDYINCMYEEYNSFKEYIPSSITNYLDIGCGIAIVNIFIKEKLTDKFNKLILIDKTETDKEIHYGFKDVASFYNSLELAKSTLIKNGFNKDKINIIEPKDNNLNLNIKFDFVISLIAWGFHFPVNTYLQEIYKNLNENGCLIIDIRKGTKGIEELKNVFKEVKVIKDFSKYSRVLCIK
jgi:SAM-dependent methyltransferase